MKIVKRCLTGSVEKRVIGDVLDGKRTSVWSDGRRWNDYVSKGELKRARM